MPITRNPLHGSQRAGLPHWALASGDNAKSPQGNVERAAEGAVPPQMGSLLGEPLVRAAR